jgi:predicted ABC-type ATPase
VRLDLVVGPNGAGKSTFVELTLSQVLPTTAFVNADEIARQQWPDSAEQHSYDAAQIAAGTRAALIERRLPLIAETVFSHPSKLDLITAAHAAGFDVAVHVLLAPEELCVKRVRTRVASGGHAVPEGKIRDRYQRLWPLVVRAIAAANTAVVYDNSHDDGPREVARFVAGQPVGPQPWPPWTPEVLVNYQF